MSIGTGKTATTIAACGELLDTCDVRGVMVFAPLKVATLAWPDELRKWDQFKKYTFAVIRGTESERIALLRKRFDFYLLNYDWLSWWVEWVRKEIKTGPLRFDMLVLDESSRLKCASSKRFKNIKPLADSNRFPRIVELTGTPLPEHYENLWSQYRLLDRGRRLGQFVTHFRDRYYDYNPYNRFEKELKSFAAQEIQERISDITYTIRAEDYLELPKVLEHNLFVELPPEARKIYKEFDKDMVSKINDTVIIAGNAAIVTEKCRQVASGAVYKADGSTIHVHQEKLDALKEFLEDLDEPCLIAYWYKHEFDMIRREFKTSPVLGPSTNIKESEKIIDQWNKGKLPHVFVHPGSIGHGINLQYGGRILVYLTVYWSNDLYRQMNGRLHRMGQTKPVLIYRILAKNTVDMLIDEVLTDKEFNQQGLRKALAKLQDQ
jgi:SNF2 family DNA or RNA helicase